MSSVMKIYPDKRVSFTFYGDDMKAFRRVHLALRDLGADVEMTDTLRVLIFSATEAELFSHAALRLQRERKIPGYSGAAIEKRFSVTVPQALVEKLSRVRDDLARKDLDVERTFIVRALLHAPFDAKALCKALPQLEAEFPDKRSLRPVRSKRRG